MNEFLEIFAWPIVLVIIALVFLLIFRKEISGFINRIKSVGRDGVQTETELLPPKDDGKKPTNLLDHIEIEKSDLLLDMENRIYEDLKTRNLESSDSVKYLVRNLAVSYINLGHEQAYYAIYGSQIRLLKKLNEVAGTGQSRVFIDEYFKNLDKEFPGIFVNWTTDLYLQFLLNNLLITYQNGLYHITVKGKDFLVWMAKTSKKEDKSF